ncbi:hypothetical protein [Pseudomonas sp. Au-Pse12]|uniref:hypothetical protein n=1 Tax=Pseudomonas sp. Au-Pse12 TaxID=2906459 RepID=UPI001E40DB9C|nr:hypothetical protein [Pseudomonas sp. Au-Pse12]MCE4057821.1 hypothetical protein [Pseudomonas sp. Au-Pse12]
MSQSLLKNRQAYHSPIAEKPVLFESEQENSELSGPGQQRYLVDFAKVGEDEFDALGQGRHRSNRAWADALFNGANYFCSCSGRSLLYSPHSMYA